MSAAAAAAPSGVVTFLFTDVDGSTRRWESDAEAMLVALAAHDKVLHAAIAARADQQHAWVLAGDDRGVCGAYPPAIT